MLTKIYTLCSSIQLLKFSSTATMLGWGSSATMLGWGSSCIYNNIHKQRRGCFECTWDLYNFRFVIADIFQL